MFEREARDRAWLAWHTAYLPRSDKPVPFDSLYTGGGEAEPEELLSLRIGAAAGQLSKITAESHMKKVG